MARSADQVLKPAVAQSPVAAIGRHGGRRWRAFKRHRPVLVGLLIVSAFAVSAVLAPWLAPADPLATVAGRRLQAPSVSHVFGTDEFSRDVFSRVLHGTRVSLAVALSVVMLCTTVGGTLGLLAGFYRGVDRVLMRILDGLMAFPGILLAIAVAAVLRPSVGTVVATLVLVYTPAVARVVRAPTLANKEAAYVQAARALGASDARILLLHLLPNALAPLLVQATFTFSFGILAEATLSFLGLGVPPPTPSWGNMLTDAKDVLQQAPWLTVAPGAALVLFTVGLNLLGDGLRDLLDPRHFTLAATGSQDKRA